MLHHVAIELAMTRSGISLPQPVRARLRSFSLYDNASEIMANFGDGVFCLAGANGLGKSTFLAAISFGVTGVVAEPGRAFSSADEYLKNCRAYSNVAFEGRIRELDRATAEVEVVMLVGNAEYRIVRNMFEPTALRVFEIRRNHHLEIDGLVTASDEERHVMYEAALSRDIGVQTFAQFVMIHHLIQTFDERRHLLFWDEKVTQAALFLAFGLDPEYAKTADNLRRQAERADSRARNHQYAATTARRRIRELEERRESLTDDDSDVDELQTLQDQVDEASRTVAEASVRHRDAEVRRAGIAASLRSTRAQYEQCFQEIMFGRRDPKTHPVVQSILDSSKCPVCGCTNEDVAVVVETNLNRKRCPLCITPMSDASGASVQLDQLDDRVRELEASFESACSEVKRQLAALEAEQDVLNTIRSRLEEKEEELGAGQVSTAGSSSTLERVIESYQNDIQDRMKRKDDERRRRDGFRQDLRRLQNSLAQSYREAEAEFVPAFTGLAREFLGLELDLDFEISADVSRLVLSVEGTARRGPINLSESQRFFVDIALRMALTRQLSAEGATPALYVDTPEGSLDIAYERRAGSMFGRFIADGGQILMTANINTSELLFRLAETCTSARMQLQRMTDWATLSEVQLAEQDAFDRAFWQIEDSLTDGR